MIKMKCKECKYCKQIERSEIQRYSLGRKQYFCENPETYKLKNKYGYQVNNFVGYGDTTLESPLQLKTSKKWCPLKAKES